MNSTRKSAEDEGMAQESQVEEFTLVWRKRRKKKNKKERKMEILPPIDPDFEMNAGLGERVYVRNPWPAKGKTESMLSQQHERKIQKQKRRKGRKSLEKGEEDKDEIQGNSYEHSSLLDSRHCEMSSMESAAVSDREEIVYTPRVHRPRFWNASRELSDICAKFASSGIYQNSQTRLTDAFLRAAGLLISASMATDARNMALIVMGAASQYISTSSLETLVYEWRDTAEKESDELQGASSFLLKARSILDKSSSLNEVPMWKFITNVLVLTVYSGYRPSEMSIASDSMREIISSIEKHLLPTISTISALDALLSIAEFIVDMVSYVSKGGTFAHFLFPKTIVSRVAQISAEYEILESGAMFEDGGRTAVYDYGKRIDTAIADLEKTLETPGALKGHLQTAYLTTLSQLRKFQVGVTSFLTREGFRMRPYFIVLTGESGVGKSHAIPLIRKLYEGASGRKYDNAEYVDLPAEAKFDDVVTSATKIASVDDLGNTRMQNRDAADTFLGQLVRVVNNVPALTRQAELSKKGKIWWGLDCLIVTSNLGDFGASLASNYPISLTNRARKYEMRPIAKYRNADGSLNRKALRKDSVNGVSPPAHEFRSYDMKQSIKPGTKGVVRVDALEWTDMKTWCQEVMVDMRRDIKNETTKVKQYKKLQKVPLCGTCNLLKMPGWCECANADDEEDEEDEEELQAFSDTMSHAVMDLGNVIYHHLARNAFPRFLLSLNWWGAKLAFYFLANTACAVMKSYSTANFFWRALMVSFLVAWYTFSVRNLPILCLVVLNLVCFYFLTSALSYFVKLSNRAVKNRTLEVIKGKLPVNALLYAGAAMLGIGCFRMVRALLNSAQMDTQGNLNPTSKEEVHQRLKEKTDWVREHKLPYSGTIQTRTTTPNQLIGKLKKNMYQFSLLGKIRSFGVFISSRIFLINNHTFEMLGGSKNMVLEKENVLPFEVEIEQSVLIKYEDGTPSDYRLLVLRKSPAMGDLVQYFSDKAIFGKGELLLTDHEKLTSESVHIYTEKGVTDVFPNVTHSYIRYETPNGTVKGDCGSPLISTTGGSTIVGLHCLGSKKGKTGGALPLYRSILKKAIHECNDMVIQGGDGVPVAYGDKLNLDPYGQGGVDFDNDLDERHFMHYYPEAPQRGINVVGFNAQSRVKGFSQISHSPAYDHCKELGVEITHGPPKLRADRDANAYMEVHVQHMEAIDSSLIKKARKKVFEHLAPKITQLGFKAKPLSIDQALNGVPGNRFISPLDETKSAGFGCKGKKAELLDVGYDEDSGRKILSPKPELVEEVEKSLDKLKECERINNVFKACLKDEPVKIDENGEPKKASRIFMADTFCQTLLVKMFFAPLQTFLLSLPLASTNGAGINAVRDEWGQAFEFLTQGGKCAQRIMCGDYSKWDQRLDGQTLRECSLLLMQLAQVLGYSNEECMIMLILLEGIIEKYVLMGGAMLFTQHGMPSGAFITLLMNGLANMLLHVCAFLDWNPFGNFFNDVHLLTVGDDCIAGVNEGVSFDQIIMSAFCHRHGMVYTDDNKGIISQRYTNIFSVKFCQRAFVWNELIQNYTAALNLASIWKSIYMCRSRELEKLSIFIQNSEAAVLELARHDRETFEHNIAVLRMVADRLDVSHCIKRLNWEWEEIQEEMRLRYFNMEDLIMDSPPSDVSFP